jgi:hypothetical protein
MATRSNAANVRVKYSEETGKKCSSIGFHPGKALKSHIIFDDL